MSRYKCLHCGHEYDQMGFVDKEMDDCGTMRYWTEYGCPKCGSPYYKENLGEPLYAIPKSEYEELTKAQRQLDEVKEVIADLQETAIRKDKINWGDFVVAMEAYDRIFEDEEE